MTAMNILVQTEAAHIFSDGAAYDDHGNFLFAAPKVFALPHLGAAIGVRGPWVGLSLLVGSLAMLPNFDALKAGASDFLAGGIDVIKRMTTDTAYGSDLELFVAGWGTDGPEAFTVGTYDRDGAAAWQTSPIVGLSLAPGDPEIHREAWSFLAGRDADDLNPEVDGLKLLEAQRARKMRRRDGTELFGVGGFAQLTTVRRDGIQIKILKSWLDQPGEKITPGRA